MKADFALRRVYLLSAARLGQPRSRSPGEIEIAACGDFNFAWYIHAALENAGNLKISAGVLAAESWIYPSSDGLSNSSLVQFVVDFRSA